jgi:hypothetical protein
MNGGVFATYEFNAILETCRLLNGCSAPKSEDKSCHEVNAVQACLTTEHVPGFYHRLPYTDVNEEGRFPVAASCVTISNPDSLFSCETGANPGIRSWKGTYFIELNVRKPSMVSLLQKSEELRLCVL